MARIWQLPAGMRGADLAIIVFLLGVTGPTFAQAPDTLTTVVALDREVQRITSEQELWPGFEPDIIPLAVFDGQTTHLFRHPTPPEEFASPREDGETWLIHEGRHPSVTANNQADIGGTMTATLLLDGPVERADLARLAAVALHEAFHVFQGQRHAGWQANEGELFVYPIDDPGLLALRRLETAALGRAQAASDEAESACWASQALDLRRQRFEALDEPFVAYERNAELWEGLASYIQVRAEGRDGADFPSGGFAAMDVRERPYVTGPAMALLLDRFQPGWSLAVESESVGSLDEALRAALEGRDVTGCAFEPAESAEATETAKRDVETLLTARRERQKQFERLDGWRITVEAADGRPLWPQGFDPLNVERLDDAVLHTRYLKLGNDSGVLEAIDTADTDLEALTNGAGPHPLFNGVRRVVIAGLSEPAVEPKADGVTVQTDGLSAEFSGAEVRWGERELLLSLRPAE